MGKALSGELSCTCTCLVRIVIIIVLGVPFFFIFTVHICYYVHLLGYCLSLTVTSDVDILLVFTSSGKICVLNLFLNKYDTFSIVELS